MTTKLWIYFFTLIGGIIQISLQTYEEKPDDFYVICFTIAGAIAMTLATACKNRIRSFGEDATFFLLVGLVIYLFLMTMLPYLKNLAITGSISLP